MNNASATPAAPVDRPRELRTEGVLPAIGLVLLSVALFSIMDALSKVLAA